MALEIYAYKCKKCGQLHYPFRMVCKKCGKNELFEFDTVPLPRKGKLLTFTTVYNLPPDFNVAKLGLGIVELENGMRITGQIKIPQPEARDASEGQGRDRPRSRIQQELRHGVLSGVMLLSIGDQVKPGTYRLHSRFSRAVNFEHRGRLVSVVDETIGPGPWNIVISDLKLALARGPLAPPTSILKGLHHSAQGWFAGAKGGVPTLGKRPSKVSNPEGFASRRTLGNPLPLQITPGTVLFAGRRYHFTARQRYNSTLDLQPCAPPRFQHNLCALGGFLQAAAPAKSLAFLLDAERRRQFRAGFERAFADQITRGVHQVFHGHLLPGIRQLKGCGLGLTPAGDDFIAGLLIGLHLLEKLGGDNAQPTANAVFRAARGDNIFSNTFLDLARRGLMFGRMKDLLLALVSGSEGSVRRAARKLFAIGETSGADLATGLFMQIFLLWRPAVSNHSYAFDSTVRHHRESRRTHSAWRRPQPGLPTRSARPGVADPRPPRSAVSRHHGRDLRVAAPGLPHEEPAHLSRSAAPAWRAWNASPPISSSRAMKPSSASTASSAPG